MDKLSAVNLILRKLGEIPVTSIDEPYSTLAIALPALDESRIRLLSEGWWFNTFYENVLQPNTTGEVITPADCLKFFPDDSKFTFVGARIRMTDTGSIYVNEPVQGRLIIDIPFEDLPEVAQYAVAYSAAFDTYVSDIGRDDISRDLEQRVQGFKEQMGGDHTVSRKLNSRQRKQVMRWRQGLRSYSA